MLIKCKTKGCGHEHDHSHRYPVSTWICYKCGQAYNVSISCKWSVLGMEPYGKARGPVPGFNEKP